MKQPIIPVCNDVCVKVGKLPRRPLMFCVPPLLYIRVWTRTYQHRIRGCPRTAVERACQSAPVFRAVHCETLASGPEGILDRCAGSGRVITDVWVSLFRMVRGVSLFPAFL